MVVVLSFATALTASAANTQYNGTSDHGAPEWGNWAWVTGTTFGGKSFPGNTHWWTRHHWVTQGKLDHLKVNHATGNPHFEMEMFKPGGFLGLSPKNCDKYHIKGVRIHNLPNSRIRVLSKCGSKSIHEQAEIVISNPAVLALGTGFDFTVDADHLPPFPIDPPMEVNFSFSSDPSGLLGHEEEWKGKVELCDRHPPMVPPLIWEDKAAQPGGIITTTGPCP